MQYDYLIVGAGLYSAVFSEQMIKRNCTCLIIERRNHIAGNIYTENQKGIHVHKYGAHIFHTNDEKIWNYVNKFAIFQPFINSPIAIHENTIYNLPFNMNTFTRIWNITTPEQAKAKIEEQIRENGIVYPRNLEEKALSLVGKDIYEILIKGYTEKQWGRSCSELPAFIIHRIPIRYTYDNNYFDDKYQGIPIGGYTQMVKRMLEGCEVLLDTPFNDFISKNPNIAKKVLYTGSIDELLCYEYGPLEYRSLCFEEKTFNTENFQGNAVINYTEKEIPYTRTIEHKFFDSVKTESTVVSYEYPDNWTVGKEAYYPLNDTLNNNKYKKYVAKLKEKFPNFLLGGRLGLYSYINMDEVIDKALLLSETEGIKLGR